MTEIEFLEQLGAIIKDNLYIRGPKSKPYEVYKDAYYETYDVLRFSAGLEKHVQLNLVHFLYGFFKDSLDVNNPRIFTFRQGWFKKIASPEDLLKDIEKNFRGLRGLYPTPEWTECLVPPVSPALGKFLYFKLTNVHRYYKSVSEIDFDAIAAALNAEHANGQWAYKSVYDVVKSTFGNATAGEESIKEKYGVVQVFMSTEDLKDSIEQYHHKAPYVLLRREGITFRKNMICALGVLDNPDFTLPSGVLSAGFYSGSSKQVAPSLEIKDEVTTANDASQKAEESAVVSSQGL